MWVIFRAFDNGEVDSMTLSEENFISLASEIDSEVKGIVVRIKDGLKKLLERKKRVNIDYEYNEISFHSLRYKKLQGTYHVFLWFQGEECYQENMSLSTVDEDLDFWLGLLAAVKDSLEMESANNGMYA